MLSPNSQEQQNATWLTNSLISWPPTKAQNPAIQLDSGLLGDQSIPDAITQQKQHLLTPTTHTEYLMLSLLEASLYYIT